MIRHLSLLGCILLSVLPVAAAVVPTNAFADGTWQFLSSFLCNADDIAIDSQHNVYVLDMGEYPTIKVFNFQGDLLREEWGFAYARAIAIDDDDFLYVLNYLHEGYSRRGWVETVRPELPTAWRLGLCQ